MKRFAQLSIALMLGLIAGCGAKPQPRHARTQSIDVRPMQPAPLPPVDAQLAAPASQRGASGPPRTQLSDQIYQLTSGREHTCILLAAGKAACWGKNDRGQLGDGTTNPTRRAVAVLELVGAIELQAGSRHTCARDAEGDVFCWGDRTLTQFASAGSRLDYSTRPTRIANLPDTIQLRVGGATSCAILQNGRVQCWGDLFGAEPRPVAGVEQARSIAINGTSGCSIDADGEVRCWKHGQASFRVEGITGAGDVALGDTRACARTIEDRVACWNQDATHARATELPVLERIAELVGDQDFFCARATDGRVGCFGPNVCGAGTSDASSAGPARPAWITNLPPAADVYARGATACATTATGEVSCWGVRLGALLHGSAAMCDPLPRRMYGISNVVELAGTRKRLCMRSSSGSVACVGDNEDGQLGDDSDALEGTPQQVALLDNVAQISVGDAFSCARTESGNVWCWGENDWGQLAQPDMLSHSTPQLIDLPATATQIELGAQSACARLDNRRVYCWGRNGNNHYAPRALAGLNREPVEISVGLRSVCVRGADESVSCWNDWSSQPLSIPSPPHLAWMDLYDDLCAIGRDGVVRCWMPLANGWQEKPLARSVFDAVDLANGASQTCAIVGGGVLYCWSGNSPTPTRFGQLDTLASVGAFGSHFCTRGMQGSVQCWGAPYGRYGEWDEMVSIMLPEAALDVRPGSLHACARTRSAKVFCWGTTQGGRLGNGANSSPTEPVWVQGLP